MFYLPVGTAFVLNGDISLALLQASVFQGNPVNQQQILVGSVVVFLCVLLFFKERWFLENTKKGKRLISLFGRKFALPALRGLILLGILFGTLLATGIIRPIQWH